MKNNLITDDYRIVSALPTITSILNSNPSRIIITSHFGRPDNGYNPKYSLTHILTRLEELLQTSITFLPNGISKETINLLNTSNTSENNSKIFLLENLRFHKEETNYLSENTNLDVVNLYNELGDIFICDAFGCIHRSHLSITGVKQFNKTIGYGHLINNEILNLQSLINPSKKILCIIGGNKIADKLPIIDSFKKLPNATIYVAGGLAKHYNHDSNDLEKIFVMNDAWGNSNLELEPRYIPNIFDTEFNTELKTFDIGPKSKAKLFDLILQSDIVFWNGSLGVIENDFYRQSSIELLNYLETLENIQTIIGGGETGSLVKNKNSKIYVSTGGGALLEYLQQKFNDGSNIVGLQIYE